MSLRNISALLAAAVVLAAAATNADAYILEKSEVALIKPKKKGQAARVTTVKSSKSNTSDRMGGGKGAARRATVKSSKSNSSDRMGGGGGRGAASRATTVKSSKSNSSDRMGGGGGGGIGGTGIGFPRR